MERSAAAEPPSGPRTQALVGRERELNALAGGLEDAFCGRGRLFLVTGEPGIGKTRLAEEVASLASRRGGLALWANCREGGGAPAYWPWVQLLRALVRAWSPELLRAETRPYLMHVAEIVPELRARVPNLPDSSAVGEQGHARFAFFDAVGSLLKDTSSTRQLTLVIDDLHAADRPSLLLLAFLARELRDTRILALGTCCDTEIRRRPDVGDVIGEIARHGQRVPLAGLSEADVGLLIDDVAGMKVPARVATAVHRSTEGNPLFVGEVVRLLASEGRLERPEAIRELGVPEGVRQAIHRRLEGFLDDWRQILDVAAVIGRQFDLDCLERVSALPQAQVLDLLDHAVANEIVARIPSAVGRFGFVHGLVREVLYDEMSSARRMRLHHRIGEALEQLGSEGRSSLTELAHHFFEAAASGVLAKAIDYAEEAAGDAARRYAYEEAVEQCGRALELCDRIEPRDDARRCRLLLVLGDAQVKAGEVGNGRQHLEQAAELARARGLAPELARAALLFAGEEIQMTGPDERETALLGAALDTMGTEDSELRATLLARQAIALHFTDPRRAIALSAQAVDVARRLGAAATLADALHARHWALWGRGAAEDRLAIATEIIRFAEESSSVGRRLRGHFWRLLDLLELDDIAGADREQQTYTRLAEETRQPWWLWRIRSFQAARALREGRFADGERLMHEALALGQQAQSANAALFFATHLVSLLTEQGRLAELEPSIRSYADQAPASAVWRSVIAFIHCELGREAEARFELERLVASDFSEPEIEANWPDLGPPLSVLCAFVGDARRSERLYEILLPWAGRNFVGGLGDGLVCAAAHHLGLLAATTGRLDVAAAHFEAALAQNARMGARPYVVRTQYEYARMLVARSGPADLPKAERLVAEALHTAESLGMSGLAGKLGALQQRFEVAGEPAADVARGTTSHDNVFRREGDYWLIAHRGRVLRLRDVKGLRLLAHLLREPGCEFHAVMLIGVADGGEPGAVARDAGADAGPLLDATAKDAYRRRLVDLRREVEEARSLNDPGRIARAEAEIDVVGQELARAVGLGGRDRRATSAAERARWRMTKAIQAAIGRIEDADASLGHHLRTCVRTGMFFSYVPDPASPVRWDV